MPLVMNRKYSFNSRLWAPGYGAQTYTEHELNLRLPGRNKQLNIIFQSFAVSPSRECFSTKFTYKSSLCALKI